MTKRTALLVAVIGIPVVDVAFIFLDGMIRSGKSDVPSLAILVFGGPPTAGFVIGLRYWRSVPRAIAMAVTALLMIGVSYLVLFVPAAIVCTAVKGHSCI
jgi:hypothetical protein